jgi:hypothetical protein
MAANCYITARQVQNDPHPQGRANHGVRWTAEHFTELHNWWCNTTIPFEGICNSMGRSHSSIIAKLAERGYVKYDISTGGYAYNPAARGKDTTQPQPTTPKEETMTANIETKTFIAGTDAANMDDTQIFRYIAKLEGEIDRLKAIRAGSKKLQAAIAKLEEDVQALVEYVDGRS